MSSPTTWVSPGDWTGLSGHQLWVLSDTAQEPELVRALWQVVSSSEGDADRVLNCLLGRSLENLAGFVIAAAKGDTVRLVARFPGTISATDAEGTREIAPAAGITWIDVSQPVPDRLVLSAGAGGMPAMELPLALGASAASSLRVDFTESLPEDTGAVPFVEEVPAQEVAQDPLPIDPPPLDLLPVDPLPLDPPPLNLLPVDPPPLDLLSLDALPAEQGVIADEPEVPVSANPYLNLLIDSTSDRDALLEQLARADAVETEAAEAEPPTSGTTAAWQDTPPESTAAQDDEQPPVPDPAPSASPGMIDGIPGMIGSVPGIAPPSVAQLEVPVPTGLPAFGGADESENRTINRAHLRDLLQQPAAHGPTVLAVRCPQGHTSNPVLPTCRQCGTAIPDQDPHEILRPQLGQITMPNGDAIPLDKSVVLGRWPQAVEGGDQHLVTVNSTGEISRQHALVTLDGWNVMVRDLNTTNGTFLTLPGQPTVQLRSGEDYLVEPGSEIDLADALTLRFEVR